MNKNSKASTGGGMAEASQDSAKINLQQNINKRLPTKQPGTALCAYLRRYRDDLLSLPLDKHVSSLTACADFILDEVDRGHHD